MELQNLIPLRGVKRQLSTLFLPIHRNGRRKSSRLRLCRKRDGTEEVEEDDKPSTGTPADAGSETEGIQGNEFSTGFLLSNVQLPFNLSLRNL
jgi:hypothetical protein